MRDGEMPRDTGLALIFVVVVVCLAAQAVRLLLPLAYDVRESAGIWAAALLAIAVFASPLTAPLLDGVGGPGHAMAATALSTALLRLAAQVIHPVSVWLAATLAALALVALTMVVAHLRRMSPAGMLPVGIVVGLLLDGAVNASFGTWDPVWRSGWTPLSLAIIMVGLVAASASGAIRLAARSIPTPAWSLMALGPFLALECLWLTNPAAADATAGVSLVWGTATMVGATVVSLVVLDWGRAWSTVGAAAAGAVLAIAAWLLSSVTGPLAIILVFVAQPAAVLLMAVALAPGNGEGTVWSSAIAMATGTVVFAVVVFTYQIAIQFPLPFSRSAMPALAALALAGSGVGRRVRGTVLARPPRWVPLVAVGALVVPIGLFLTQEALPVGPAPATVRLMDWNIHSGVDDDGQLRPDAVADTIRAAGADVVVLQEVPRGWLINGGLDLAELLRRDLRMPYAWAAAADPQFGNLILSRLPIEDVSTGMLPYGAGPQHRSYVLVRVGTEAGPLTVVGAHLENKPGTSTRANQILAILAAVRGMPRTIVAGDLNMQPDDADRSLFVGAGAISAQDVTGNGARSTARSPNFPGDRPDWIWGTADLAFTGFAIQDSDVSDHLPLAVTVGPRP